MTERCITSLLIEKLGHEIEEIRKRALYNIISKLDNGILFDSELARNIQLFNKLINWFQFEPCIEQQTVINLIDKIIKLQAGKSLIKYLGSDKIIDDLNNIKKKVTPSLHKLIDDIIEYVESAEENQNVVPPLVSELPLSYRSNQENTPESSRNFSNKSNVTQNETELRSFHFDNSSARSTEKKPPASDSKDELIELYAPQVTPHPSSTTISSLNTIKSCYSSIVFSILQWQPIVIADYHVLKSVENTLQEPADMSAILNSCEFFYNVMLEDFPSEIFLQRPTIILLFYDFLNTCPSTRVLHSVLTCFKKLIEKLLSQLEYYSDPSTKNFKLKTFVPKNISNDNDKQLDNNLDNEDDKNENVPDQSSLESKQIPIPIFCLDTLYYVLIYISERRMSFQDQDSKKKIQGGINVALEVIDKLIILLNKCIKPSLWNEHRDEFVVEVIKKLHVNFIKFGETLEQFRLMVVATEMEYFERMAQLHLLNSICVLISHLIPITKADEILPRVLKNTLSNSLLDASFARNFPKPHETLVQYVAEFSGNADVDSLSKYKEINRVCKSMTSFIKNMKDDSNVSIKDKLILIENSIASLEFHRILNLESFFNFFTKNSTLFSTNEELQKIVETIFLRLLSHDDEEIQKKTYDGCNNFIKKSLGIHSNKDLMNDSPGSDVLFFITPAIINEIAAYGLVHECIQIQVNAEDILMHILKCKFIVTEENWKKIVNVLMQIFPILQCFANKTTPLGKSLIKMMDPDISSSIFISQLDVIKGNLLFLLSKEVSIKREAVSRLCWLLSLEKDSEKKIPKIKTLDDFTLLNVFQKTFMLDLSRIKVNRQFYEVNSLYQVMDLLSVENLEPNLHRSALTQIGVITSDHFVHAAFLERNGLETVLKILQNSVLEEKIANYSECTLPCITILKNICLYGAVIRRELSRNLDLFYCLLRVLIINNCDRSIQQDGALLLCLLLFSDYIMHNVLGNNIGFSLPRIILHNLELPFKFNEHWKSSPNAKPSIAKVLLPDNWSKCTVKMHWNILWYGGINEVIDFVESFNSPIQNKDVKFNTELALNKEDVKALKASSPLYCCKNYLFTIQSATTHEDVLYCLRGLYGYISLLLETTNREYFSYEELLSLPWQKSLNRFLSAPPANHNDEILLKELVQLLSRLFKIAKYSGKESWINDILSDFSHSLYDTLKNGVNNENHIVNLEILSLISDYSLLEQNILDSNMFVNESKEKIENISWIYLINILTDNLKFNDSGQFYNLSYLDKLLSCMVKLTSISGWCEERHHSVDINNLLSVLIECLSELLTAFHHGKGTDASSSFMGLNITRNALLIMNHVLHEMQNYLKKNWEAYWINDKVCNAAFLSLYSLWLCRDVIVRSSILQLLSGLVLSARGATVIVEKIYQNGQGVWQSVLSILLDHTEASAVREQAALLLTNLCSHVNISSNGNVSLPLCHISMISDEGSSANEILFLFLKKNNFFEELNDVLLCLYLDCVFEVTSDDDVNDEKCAGPLSSQLHQHKSTSAVSGAGSTENKLYILTTPSLVKNTALFINNLLYIEPEKTTNLLYQHGLIRSYFRCLSSPPLNVNDLKSVLLYTSILEMCAVICSLLSKSVIINSNCHSMVLNTRDCLHVLISLLNPELFEVHSPYFVYLRDKLWCEILHVITALLSSENQKETEEKLPQSYKIIISHLLENGYDHFIKSIYISLESKLISLQRASLKFLISIFSPDITIVNNESIASLINFIDETKNTKYHQELEDSLNKNNEGINFYNSKGDIIKNTPSPKLLDNQPESEVTSVGNQLCKILISLYRQHNWEKSKDSKKKALILEAISMLLKFSNEAKNFALRDDLLSDLMKNLKNLHTELSLHTIDSLRKTTDKKILCPILLEVETIIGVCMNFMLYNDSVKKSASDKELADILHKYWVWSTVNRSLQIRTLKTLCTFTVHCEDACQSLILTNPTPGSGPRKTVSGISLLHAVIILISKEIDLVSRTRDLTVLILCFNLLKNVCLVSECRNVITKTSLLQCFNRIHPLLTKHQRPWETVEKVLLEFLEVFTFYPEGQLSFTKSFDQIEVVMSLASSTKSINKISALNVLRNVTFHQNNRAVFLSSVGFLQLLQSKLIQGSNEEKNIIVTIIWSLIANNQRSKILIKCAGLDAVLKDIIKQYEVQGISDNSYQTLLYVYGLLNEGEK